jgi:hypothetical protein
MTDNKKLKARVRERMARTGESYTTAHAHVLAAGARTTPRGQTSAREPAPGLVDGYPLGEGYEHRESALAARLLTQAGVPLDETLACGLGGGIGFLYAVFDYREVAHPLLTVVAQHHPQPWLDAVTEHLGLELRTTTGSAARPAMARLDEALTGGRAASLAVSRAQLAWHDDVDPMEAADAYRVTVAGRDGDDYLVDDLPGGPSRLAGTQLAAAWQAHRKGRFAMSVVVRPGGEVDLAAGCRRALSTTVGHLTGPVLGVAYDVNFGFSGMARLVADLRDTRTKAGWARRYPDAEGLAYATARLAQCLTDAHTAPGGTRPLYAGFVRAAADLLGAPGLDRAAEDVDSAGRCWLDVCEVALRAAQDAPAGGLEAGAVLAQLADLVETAAGHEERAVARIRAVL